MATPLVVVIPATSNSGAQAIRSLLSGAFAVKPRVRAAVRSAEKAAEKLKDVAAHPDYEVVSGIDAATVEGVMSAFAGADYAVIVTPHDPAGGMDHDAEKTANMIKAAIDHKVKHIVYVGSWTVKAPEALKGLASRFLPSEELLQATAEAGGPRFTSLRSGFFFQNYMAWAAGIKAGCVKWPTFQIPSVDPRDVGRVAAAILASEDPSVHHGQFYEISGPRVMATKEVIDIIASKLGKEIQHEEIPYDSLTFLPPFLQELFGWMGKTGEGAVPFSEDTLKICGEHTTFEAWLDDGFINGFKG